MDINEELLRPEGIRAKQLNLPDLYAELDKKYGSVGATVEVTVGTEWNKDGNYFVQTIDNVEGITANSKMIVQVKEDLNATHIENLEKEGLFSHIVKITSSENSLTIYSSDEIRTSFEIQILYFN